VENLPSPASFSLHYSNNATSRTFEFKQENELITQESKTQELEFKVGPKNPPYSNSWLLASEF
jgi:hypothetical protein